MTGNLSDQNTMLVAMRVRELRAAAEEDRRARQVRGERPLRRRVGGMLITAGRRLSA